MVFANSRSSEILRAARLAFAPPCALDDAVVVRQAVRPGQVRLALEETRAPRRTSNSIVVDRSAD
jgi:hypothetical protein